MATGEPSGVWVWDVEADGLDDLKHLEATDGDRLPDVPTTVTGGGGKHLFFALNGKTVTNWTKIQQLHIDVRGTGGYVLLPPSNHASGSRYTWLRTLDEYEPEEAPDWLFKLVATEPALAIDGGIRKTEGTPVGTVLSKLQSVSETTGGWIACCPVGCLKKLYHLL